MPIFGFLSKRGYEMEGEYVVIEGWPVQFLAPPGSLGEEALDQAETIDAGGIPVRIVGAEHLAAIALATGRAKDKARLLMFFEHPGFNRLGFEAIVQRHGLGDAWARFVREFQVEP